MAEPTTPPDTHPPPPLPQWLSAGLGGTPLVMLHGMGSTAPVWLPQLQHFGTERRCVAWSMPGYAGSPPLPDLSWPALAETLDALRAALGIERMHLLGHSIGGMVAQAYALRYPQHVASLLLSATSPGFGRVSADWLADFLAQRDRPLQAFGSFAAAAPTLLRGFMGPLSTPSAMATAELAAGTVGTDAYRSAMRLLTTFDSAADLPRLHMPTLLLAGSLDSQAPVKAMQRMLAKLPTTACNRLVVLDQVGHMANLESPDAFNRAVADFLAEVEAMPAAAQPFKEH